MNKIYSWNNPVSFFPSSIWNQKTLITLIWITFSSKTISRDALFSDNSLIYDIAPFADYTNNNKYALTHTVTLQIWAVCSLYLQNLLIEYFEHLHTKSNMTQTIFLLLMLSPTL